MQALTVSDISVSFEILRPGYMGLTESHIRLAFNGRFLLGQIPLPVSVIIDTKGVLSVYIKDNAPVQIGSIDSLASFIGNIKIEDMLPAGCKLGTLYLESLYLVTGYDKTQSWSVQTFNFNLQLSASWNILEVILIEKIALSYSREKIEGKPSNSFFLLGEMKLDDMPFSLSIRRANNGAWEACGETINSISLSGLVNYFCKTLNLGQIPLPDITLDYISFMYNSGESRFKIAASALISEKSDNIFKFEEINAGFVLECEKKDNKWKCGGSVKGNAVMLSSVFSFEMEFGEKNSSLRLIWCSDSVLRINLLFAMLGFQLPDILNIAVKSLEISYNFLNGDMLVKAVFGDNGENILQLTSALDEKKERQYLFGARLPVIIGLKGLPVVGSVDMLAKVSVKDILLLVSSCDIGNKTIEGVIENLSMKKGALLSASLVLPDMTIPLNLPVSAGLKQTASDANKDGVIIKIEKSLGPFHFKAVRLSFAGGAFLLALDSSFNQSVLAFELNGLAAGYALSERKVKFMLDGLDVSVDSGTLSIGGGFNKNGSNSYSGSLLIKTPAFSITAAGAYDEAENTPSIFAFALLRANIGGPPCFFITGIAVGFGYNRALNIPSIDTLKDFPLLKAAFGSLSESGIFNNEEKYFPPKINSSWAAAGVLFNSFRMIDSFALLTIAWGSRLEINLLGRSVLNVPFNKNSSDSLIAHAVLLLNASFRPDSSLIAVDAALSSESYVLSRDCHITGSFAFYTWYGGVNKGDFVLTLGGYHNRYNKPAHYPSASRLRLSWIVSKNLSVTGELYFALTPSCVMAGGRLNLQYKTSCVRAWFNAYVDMLIQWKPFHYDVAIGVSIGVCADLGLFSITLELGCDLHIWGPEFSGEARVSLWCISFTVSFGNSSKNIPSLSAAEFIESFLPKTNASNGTTFGGCCASIGKGLLREIKKDENTKKWVICAETFTVTTQSAVPATSLLFNGSEILSGSQKIYARPCRDLSVSSAHNIKLARKDGVKIDTSRFACASVMENVPSALWAHSSYKKETTTSCTGLSISSLPADYYTLTFAIDPFVNPFVHALKPVPKLPSNSYKQELAYDYIKKINDSSAAKARKELLSALGEEFLDIELSSLAKNPEGFFCSRPALASLGGV